jgi:hypothetical protein
MLNDLILRYSGAGRKRSFKNVKITEDGKGCDPENKTIKETADVQTEEGREKQRIL